LTGWLLVAAVIGGVATNLATKLGMHTRYMRNRSGVLYFVSHFLTAERSILRDFASGAAGALIGSAIPLGWLGIIIAAIVGGTTSCTIRKRSLLLQSRRGPVTEIHS
jgi:hypothetical protein